MKRSLAICLLFGLPFVLMACNAPSPTSSPPPIVVADVNSLDSPAAVVTAAANGTPTPTPFHPINPTVMVSTPLPTATQPTWGNYPGPSVPASVQIPPPVEPFAQPAGQVNILLFGSDMRPDGGGFRTDTILLVTLNPNAGTASITSFPRDLYVYIPGWTMQRINTAHQHGGFPLTQATFEYNFGVKPDHFLMVNFWVFEQTINNLGGINVRVAQHLTDHRDGYGDYHVAPGVVHMDGATALWYVRARYTTSDFDRTRRQQEALLAIFERMISLDGVSRAPELYNLYRDNVITDLTFEDAAPLLGLATQLGNDTSRIHTYAIGSAQVQSYRTPGGAAVLLPIRDDVLAIMRQALNAP